MIEANQSTVSRGIITMAFGNQRYVDMAKDFALSLKLNAPFVPTAILTDSDDPDLKSLFNHVLPYREEFGSNVGPKFFLDMYTPFDETLYMDSDCLAVGDLETFWQSFSGQYFGVPGWRVLRKGDKDPYCDVDFLLNQFGIDYLPKFNGGAYFFRRCQETTLFFSLARDLFTRANSLRIGDFRDDGAPDEPVVALAMAISGLNLTPMPVGGMMTPINSTGPIELNVLRGHCTFIKEGNQVTPNIIHFAGEYAASFEYARERAKVRYHFKGRQVPLMELLGAYLRSVPWQISRKTRTLARRMFEWKRQYTPEAS